MRDVPRNGSSRRDGDDLADVPWIARVMLGPLDGGITLDVPVEAAEDLTDATEALAAYNFGAAG